MSRPVSVSTIGYGTHMSTPPSVSTSPWNPARSTYRTWLTRNPVRVVIVRATRTGPFPSIPPSKAALILPIPMPGISTHRSRGKDRNTACCCLGSVWMRMIVSERFSPPMSASVPKAICSSGESPSRESLPSKR